MWGKDYGRDATRVGYGKSASSGPEVYAPPDRRAPGEPVNRARVAVLRPQAPDRIQSNEGPAAHLDELIRRIAGTRWMKSITVIRELENIRALLRNEGRTGDPRDCWHLPV